LRSIPSAYFLSSVCISTDTSAPPAWSNASQTWNFFPGCLVVFLLFPYLSALVFPLFPPPPSLPVVGPLCVDPTYGFTYVTRLTLPPETGPLFPLLEVQGISLFPAQTRLAFCPTFFFRDTTLLLLNRSYHSLFFIPMDFFYDVGPLSPIFFTFTILLPLRGLLQQTFAHQRDPAVLFPPPCPTAHFPSVPSCFCLPRSDLLRRSDFYILSFPGVRSSARLFVRHFGAFLPRLGKRLSFLVYYS